MSYKDLFRKKDIQQAILDCDERSEVTLKKTLGLKDLISFGIAAIIGAGIFSTIGNACADGGPAVSLLFVFTAIACLFSALCYAQFASSIPVAGSAYTYAYVSLGELLAWIIGWDLLMEYAIGNIAVAISWSDYFTSFLNGLGLSIPEYLTMDYLTASASYEMYNNLVASGEEIPLVIKEGYNAWINAPHIGPVKLIADIPALLVVIFITYLVYIGIKESKTTSNILVILKLAVIFLIIIIGAFYVKPENWFPFAPNGVSGVLSGVSAVFFAYIGFDAISTTAEECKDSKRDLPRAMFWTLAICTLLY
ncbi:MAG TPA: amino acid permease, partial [Cytophagaceae bacterium]